MTTPTSPFVSRNEGGPLKGRTPIFLGPYRPWSMTVPSTWLSVWPFLSANSVPDADHALGIELRVAPNDREAVNQCLRDQ